MAVAGDVLIKAVFDVAQVKQGVDEANQQLNRFSNDVGQINGKLDAFSGLVKGLFAGFVLDKVIGEVSQFISTIEKNALAIADLAKKYDMSTDAVQAYQQAAQEANVSQQTMLGTIGQFNESVNRAVAGQNRYIDAFKGIGIHVLDTQGKQKQLNDLLQEASVRMLNLAPSAEKTRASLVLFGKTGQELNDVLNQTAQGTKSLIDRYKEFGLITDEEAIKKLKDLEDQSQRTSKRLEEMLAPVIATVKAGTLAAFEVGIRNVGYAFQALINLDLEKLLKVLAFAANPAAYLTGSIGSISGMFDPGKQAASNLADANRELEKAIQLRDVAAKANRADLPVQEQLVKLAEDRVRALSSAISPYGHAPPPPPPDITPSPGLDPTVHSLRTGGGRQPGVNRIEELIDKLQRQTEVARKATQEMVDKASTPLDDLEREVERTKKIGDMVADIESKVKSRGISRDKILSVVSAYVGSEEDFKRMQEFSRLAEETERRLGGGARQREAALDDLNKQMSTGRLSNVAYARSVKSIEDAFRQADEEVRRFKGGIDSFTAGFERAMRQWSEAHDLFAAGEQTFGLFVDAIGDSLDVLLGKSSKTFGEIASEFASMLAKMAAQAALSEIFKAVLGIVSAGISGSVGTDSGAWRGDSGGWFGNLFGGGKQHGGPVSPGNWYMVGERGPERFVPSSAGRIEPSGGNVYVNNYAGVDVGTSKRSNGDLDITIRAVRRTLARDIMRGGNEFAGSFENAYGVARGGNR